MRKLTQEIKKKARTKIPRHEMPEQEPKDRIQNFDEVPFGFSLEDAQMEAIRCIDCKKPDCVEGCPVGIDIPGFLMQVADGEIAAAADTIREANFLPAVCGRVCPQDQQCEAVCIVGKKGDPVSIGALERFVADYERDNDLLKKPEIAPSTGKRIAVVGSGPAGLTAAAELVVRGHDVTVYEAFHRGGGVLVYGIPRFRLPMDIIDKDLEFLQSLGVKFEYNMVIGKVLSLDELLADGFDAVFLGTGAGLPKMLGVTGENLNGVYSANEYLTRIYLMDALEFPNAVTPLYQGKKVGVIGAGNTAMDVCRTAKRMGCDVTVYYRRSADEAPARTEELRHAREEFVDFKFLSNPVEFIGNDDYFVKQIKCEKMELSEPDDSGRRRPMGTGEYFIDDVDTVVFSLGCNVNPIIPTATPEIDTNQWGIVLVDEKTGMTSKEAIFAGGDLITGGSTVILAMGQAKDAAQGIHDYVMKK